MPPWLLKAATQGTLSLLPASHRWNFLFQKYVTKSMELPEPWFSRKLQDCHRHLTHYHSQTGQALPDAVLELGTGWHPIFALAMFVSGVQQIYTVDISALLYAPVVKQVIACFLKFADSGQLATLLPLARTERVDLLRDLLTRVDTLSMPDLLATCNITAVVADARHLALDGQTVDLIVSNDTLEHIPGDTIRDIFVAFKTLMNLGAIMSHAIDLSDHYAHFDKTLTPHHFLRYSDQTWRWFNNSLHYQNRLRMSDYRMIHAQAGFVIVHEETRRSTPEVMSHVNIASQFTPYSLYDLAVTGAWIVSKP
jgi:hypothetical protein